MALSIRRTLRQRLDLRLGFFFAGIAVVGIVALDLPPWEVALLLGAAVLDVVAGAAIRAGYVHRQTPRAIAGVLAPALVVGLVVANGGSWTALVVFGLPFALGGGWVTIDALAARRAGVTESDGSVDGTANISALIATVSAAGTVFTALETAEEPLFVDDVAAVCTLDAERARSVLSVLVDQGIAVRQADGFTIDDATDGVSPVSVFVRGSVLRLLQPYRLLV